jgi:diadenosine tetraphosphate (Ap4A) HIT family hydrolase
MASNCPFCNIDASRTVAENPSAIALHDAFPVTAGHTLVVPRQHVTSIFDLAEADQTQLWELVSRVRSILTTRFSPDAFNIGINDGEAAGQTVPHAHVHIIPRYCGDVPDPRGGIRWIIPEKAIYWEAPE